MCNFDTLIVIIAFIILWQSLSKFHSKHYISKTHWHYQLPINLNCFRSALLGLQVHKMTKKPFLPIKAKTKLPWSCRRRTPWCCLSVLPPAHKRIQVLIIFLFSIFFFPTFCVTQHKLYTLYKLSSTIFCCLSVCLSGIGVTRPNFHFFQYMQA